MNAIQRRLEIKPFEIPSMATMADVPYQQMIRIVKGMSPAPIGAAYMIAGLLEQPIDALFEERPYKLFKQSKIGLFARDLQPEEGAA